eukprot:190703-Rhodomonas_salina.2
MSRRLITFRTKAGTCGAGKSGQGRNAVASPCPRLGWPWRRGSGLSRHARRMIAGIACACRVAIPGLASLPTRSALTATPRRVAMLVSQADDCSFQRKCFLSAW